LNINLGAALRRTQTAKRRAQLSLRPKESLIAAADIASQGRVVVLPDTNVYIMEAAGTLPLAVSALLERGLMFHCSVCLVELATGVANADPARTGWKAIRDHYDALIHNIPPERMLTPDEDVWIEAGVISGTLARIHGFQPYQRKECLNDALIFLTAAKAGLPVLTANRDEFDLIQQLAPRGQFIHF